MSFPVTPRPAATVMLLRDTTDGLEVLLLRRSSNTPFVPGAHVFPGGAVEDHDGDSVYDDLVRGLDDERASTQLGTPGGGRAYWIAAARECLEEAGVLLAATADGTPVTDDHPALADRDALRQQVEAGDRRLDDLCRRHDLTLTLDRMVYVAQWITPAESPRRYETRFFAAATPPGQTASADDWEAVSAAWWRPTAALESWQAGDIELIEPTVVSLELLADHDSVDDALSGIEQEVTR